MSFGMNQFIQASVDWPDMFLYLNLTNERLKGTRYIEKEKKNRARGKLCPFKGETIKGNLSSLQYLK